MFDKCRRSPTDSNNVTDTFARSNILPMDKLTSGDLVTPTPVLISTKQLCYLLVYNKISSHETIAITKLRTKITIVRLLLSIV